MLDAARDSLEHWLRLVSGWSPGARLMEADGVLATVIPAAPERSVANGVSFRSAAALEAAYAELSAAYDEIGAAWTVWVAPGQEAARPFLDSKGHVLDAAPEVMGLDLSEQTPRPDDLEDWTRHGDPRLVGPINDRCYPFGTDSFTRVFSELDDEAVNIYLASLDGEPVACSLTVDLDTNTEVQVVGVVPEARGHGLAGKLLAHALADAAERGMRTSTLFATSMGRPVYERLGFRPLGPIEMWELRRA